MTPARLAWRLGWRLAVRHRLRTALLGGVLALPVAVGAAVADLAATERVSPAEEAARAFGTADGCLLAIGGEEGQRRVAAGALADDVEKATAAVRRSLPVGSIVSYDQEVIGLSLVTTGGARVEASGRLVDVADPLTRGIYRMDGDPLPAAGPRIALSTALAARLHVSLGDALGVGPGAGAGTGVSVGAAGQGEGAVPPARPWIVSALVSDPLDLTRELFAIPPSVVTDGLTATAVASANIVGSPRWFVKLPPERSREGLRHEAPTLAAAGYRYIARSGTGHRLASTSSSFTESTALLLGLGLLVQALLLVGAAFGVVAREQGRNLALLGALGASRRWSSWFFLTYACVVAGLSSLAGASAGTAVARALVPTLAARAGADWGPFDPSWPSLILLILVTMIATVGAAVVPMRRAAREDIAARLRAPASGDGRRSLPGLARALAAIASAGIMLLGVAWSAGDTRATVALVGGLLAGVAGSSALVMALAAALWSRRPLLRAPPALRFALRVLLSSPGRTAVTIAALAMVTAVSSMAVTAAYSAVRKQQDFYQPALPADCAFVSTPRALTDAERVGLAKAIGAAAPRAELRRAVVSDGEQPRAVSPFTDLLACAERRHLMKRGTNNWHVCSMVTVSQIGHGAVGIAPLEVVEGIAGTALSGDQAAAYERGELVIALTEAALAPDGHGVAPSVTFVYPTFTVTELELARLGSWPALVLRSGEAPEYRVLPNVLISPTAARAMGASPAAEHDYLFRVPGIPGGATGSTDDSLRRALPLDAEAASVIVVEGGPPRIAIRRLLSAIAGAAIVTTALIVVAMLSLWGADLRADYQMLGALGVSARRRRAFAAALSTLLAAPGMVIGLAWGAPSIAAFLRSVSTPLSVPLGWVVAIGITTIAGAAGAGTLLTPRAVRSMRRP